MRIRSTIALLSAAGALSAGDFTWSLIGDPNEQYTKNRETALFDGQLNFNTDSVLWDANYAPHGCGFAAWFDREYDISRVVVVTAKPNQLAYTPARTEFTVRANGRWSEAATIPDVTGRADDPGFSQASINTVWQPSGVRADAIKILMYGSGVWLTEVQIYVREGGAERLLKPGAMVAADRRKPSDFGAGATVNIDFWLTDKGYIGNPNQLSRRDRAMFSFDIADCLDAGEVRSASLVADMGVFGQIDSNTIELEVFTKELPQIDKIDLLSAEVVPVAEITVTEGQSAARLEADVTDLVNQALAEGRATITFRLRNATVEKLGNRKSAAEGAAVNPAQITLEIGK